LESIDFTRTSQSLFNRNLSSKVLQGH